MNKITRSNSIVRHGDSLSVSFILRVFKFVCFAELNEDASISKRKKIYLLIYTRLIILYQY